MRVLAFFGLGVTGSRSFFVASPTRDILGLAVGPCLLRWNLSGTSISAVCLNRDLTTSVSRWSGPVGSVFVTTTFCGDVRVWNEGFTALLDTYSTKTPRTVHSAWSRDGNYIGVVSEKGVTFLLGFDTTSSTMRFVEKITTPKDTAHCFFSSDGTLHHFGKNSQAPGIPGSSTVDCVLCYDKKHKLLSWVSLNYSPPVVTTSLFLKGAVEGSLCPQLMRHGMTVMSSSKSFFMFHGRSQQQVEIDNGDEAPVASCSQGDVYYKLTESGVTSYNVSTLKSDHYLIPGFHSPHKLSCCGATFHPKDSNLFATGDLTGRVNVWRVSAGSLLLTLDSTWKGAEEGTGIRSLHWMCRGSGDTLLIGTTRGDLLRYRLQEAQVLYRLRRTVTCVVSYQNLVALGDASGRVTILDADKDFERVLEASCHDQEEIWSLCFSPDGTKLATASEDGTVKVWTLRERAGAPSEGALCGLSLLRILRGHKAAVCCVGWSRTLLGDVIATCSDDRTVLVWEPQTGHLLQHFSTVYEGSSWHTITYLVLRWDFIVAVTMDGHVYRWELGLDPRSVPRSK